MGGKLGRKFAAVVVALSAAATFAVVAQPSGADTGSLSKPIRLRSSSIAEVRSGSPHDATTRGCSSPA